MTATQAVTLYATAQEIPTDHRGDGDALGRDELIDGLRSRPH